MVWALALGCDTWAGTSPACQTPRLRAPAKRPPADGNGEATRLHYDNQRSSHSTVLEVITPDRPGLLHRVASIVANYKCNIEIPLIDTEGRMALDVFYITTAGAKLEAQQQQELREVLLEELAAE